MGTKKTNPRSSRWIGPNIGYFIDDSVMSLKNLITGSSGALRTIENATDNKIKFFEMDWEERYSGGDHLYFKEGESCSSAIGRAVRRFQSDGGKHDINLNPETCDRVGIIIHEICHAFGMWHEHNRQDRNKIVKVLWENIQEKRHNFKKYKASQGYDVGKYDFGSIMHYFNSAFGKDHFNFRLFFEYPLEYVGSYSIDSTTFTLWLNRSKGIYKVHKMNPEGSLGEKIVYSRNLGEGGWEKALVFNLNSTNYLFLLKRSNGDIQIREILPSGRVSAIRSTSGIGFGSGVWFGTSWSRAQTFELEGERAISLINNHTGDLFLTRISSSDLFVVPRAREYKLATDWSWNQAEIFNHRGDTYLYQQNSRTGRYRISRLSWGAGPIKELHSGRTSGNWKLVRFFPSGDSTFRFLLSNVAGTRIPAALSVVHEVNANGSIRASGSSRLNNAVSANLLGSGWKDATTFMAGTSGTRSRFLMLLKTTIGRNYKLNGGSINKSAVRRRTLEPKPDADPSEYSGSPNNMRGAIALTSGDIRVLKTITRRS